MNNILSNHPEQLQQRCRATAKNSAIGFSVQEMPIANVTHQYAKIYLFNYTRWNERSICPPITKNNIKA